MAEENNQKEDSYLRAQRTKGKSLRELTIEAGELRTRLDTIETAYPAADEAVEARLDGSIDELRTDYEGTRDAHTKRMDGIDKNYVKHSNKASADAERRAKEHAEAQDKKLDVGYQAKFAELGATITTATQTVEELKDLVRVSGETGNKTVADAVAEVAKRLAEAVGKAETLSKETTETVETTVATYRTETDAEIAALKTGREQDRAEYKRLVSALEKRFNRKLEKGAKLFSDEYLLEEGGEEESPESLPS